MGLLTPKGKKGDKKNNKGAQNNAQASKFIPKGTSKGTGNFTRKGMTGGGAQRGS